MTVEIESQRSIRSGGAGTRLRAGVITVKVGHGWCGIRTAVALRDGTIERVVGDRLRVAVGVCLRREISVPVISVADCPSDLRVLCTGQAAKSIVSERPRLRPGCGTVSARIESSALADLRQIPEPVVPIAGQPRAGYLEAGLRRLLHVAKTSPRALFGKHRYMASVVS
jgi:hypothetical protein